MKKLMTALGVCAGLAIVLGTLYGVWTLAVAFVSAISAARPEVSAAIIGAMATVLVGISAILLSQAHDRKCASDEAHRLKKVEIYKGFIDIVARMLGASNEHLSLIEPDTKELVQYMFGFKSDILLWGSPRVIKAHLDFENVALAGNAKMTLRAVDKIYRAIREDIGLSNYKLDNLELAKIYLKEEARSEIR